MPSETREVAVTERAQQRIAEILKTESVGSMLRVSVQGGGCSGFQYAFDIDANAHDDDLTVSGNGVTVVIDAMSLPFLKGAQIDFVDSLMGQAFQVSNPNATASCGCGTSFSV